MAIRLSSNCAHCAELSPQNLCNVHNVKVNADYTCDRFSMSGDLDANRQCTSCARYGGDTCAHPDKAADGMLCSSWAPQA